VNYLEAERPDANWGNPFTVKECFGPSGPRSTTQLTHSSGMSFDATGMGFDPTGFGDATTWGGANYVVNVHPCCLEPGARCGLILQIHGFFQNPGDMEMATDLAGFAGAEERPSSDACGSGPQRFIVVEADSRSDGAVPGEMDKHWRAKWVLEDADMHADFVRRTARLYGVDDAHIHVTGYSEGAYATWTLLCRHSELVCSIAPAEFPPYAIQNPSGGGCLMGSTRVAGGSDFYDATAALGGINGGIAVGAVDYPPTCFADAGSSASNFEPRSILFQFGQLETICGGSGAQAGVATMEETRALVGQAYLGGDLTQASYASPSPPGWTGDWREYAFDGVGSGAGLRI
jgi:pimeloyl-ACP methyl ester carboxylesterase